MLETKEWKTIDKAGWGPGPWQDEPDKKQWQDEETGLPCLIVRGPSGALCGYVGVSESHPLHGKDYNEEIPIPDGFGEREFNEKTPVLALFGNLDRIESGAVSIALALECHGGVTFADECQTTDDPSSDICHITDDEDKVWWFGFDCVHSGDLAPKMAAEMPSTLRLGGTYRDIAYVESECRSLAKQLAAAA